VRSTPSPRSLPLLALLTLVLTLVMTLLGPARGARAATDDYPWKYGSTTSSDTFGFTKRQCVSYAAWRLYKAGHRINNATKVNGRTYYWGHARTWDSMAVRLGKQVRTYTKYGKAAPKVGAIAHWNEYEQSAWWSKTGARGTFKAASYGHVAVVWKIYSDGSVLVRQYNVGGPDYSTMRVKAPRYLMI
jgi:surface antigen